MRKLQCLFYLACAVVLVVAGCGGGGGAGDTRSVQVELTVPAGAAPAGVTPTVTPKTTADYPQLAGDAFVAAAECLPHGTTFTQPVTLTFRLVTALGASDNVLLFQSDAANNWTQVPGAQVTVSADRLTVTVGNLSAFTNNGRFALLKVIP